MFEGDVDVAFAARVVERVDDVLVVVYRAHAVGYALVVGED